MDVIWMLFVVFYFFNFNNCNFNVIIITIISTYNVHVESDWKVVT